MKKSHLIALITDWHPKKSLNSMKYQYAIMHFEEQKENKIEKNKQLRTYGIISKVITQT